MKRTLLAAAVAPLLLAGLAAAERSIDLIAVDPAPPAQSRAHSIVLASWQWERSDLVEDLASAPLPIGDWSSTATSIADEIRVPRVLQSPKRQFPLTGDYFDTAPARTSFAPVSFQR